MAKSLSKVNEDCSLSPVDDTTKVEGDVVNIYLGKKPANPSGKPSVDNNKLADKPSVDKPNNNSGDKPNADKPSVDKPNADKPVVDNNKPADKVDKPVVSDKDSKVDANKVKIEFNKPAVANKNSDAPKTSDSSNITLYSALFVGAVIITSVVLKRRFRTNK